LGILSSAQTDELVRLLVAAYPSRFDFAEMLRVQLSIHLDSFAFTGAGTTDYFNVLQAAEDNNWTRRLLAACRNGNPGNKDLASFTSQFDLSPEALAQEPEVIPLPKAAPAAQPKYQPLPLTDPAEVPPPGLLPPGSRLPFIRNEVFTGRKQDLKKLAELLLYAISPSGESVGLIEALAVTGMGGIGKTQLAVEFCYRYGRFTHGVHWLDATQSIQAELAACGLAMGLQPWPDEIEAQVELTLQAITSPEIRLVVLDNLEDPAVLQTWRPLLGQARILVTSRREKWPRGSGVNTQEIAVMGPEEGRALLCKLAERLEQAPDPELDELGERLGWLPLALDLAGRYFADRTRLSIGDYLDELNKAGNALAQTSLSEWVTHNPTEHQTDLAASFLLSWEQLGEAETLAQRTFLACGYLAPNTPLPFELLEGAALEEGETEVDFDRALKRLSELGLLKSGAEGPLIHPLLAEYARLLDGHAKKARRSMTLERAIAAIVKLGNKPEVRNIPGNFMPLRPHLEQIIHWAEAIKDESLARLYDVFAYHLDTIADYPSAKLYYEYALAIEQKVLGERHLATAITMNN
jgi:hypothetical protein